MVQLGFELPSTLATTLKKHAQNEQKHIDQIVESALLMHFQWIKANASRASKQKIA